MTNSFEDALVYSICSYLRVFNSEGLQTRRPSITMAPMPSAVAVAAAEKCLQDIYKQELKDYKQECAYKAALNQATLKVFAASIAQAKLATDKIYQAQLAAIKKNPTIINAVETNSSKFSLPSTIKSLDLLLPRILVSKVTII